MYCLQGETGTFGLVPTCPFLSSPPENAKKKQYITPIFCIKMTATLLKELHLFKEQIAEGLCELPILHQQEVAQSLKVSLHP